MKASEIINSVKELLTLSQEEKDVVAETVVEEVELSVDAEEVVSEEVILADEAPAVEAAPEVVSYVTPEELSAVKMELLSMIKALIEDKSTPETKEVPEELSAQEVELSVEEAVEEVVHSPEATIETKKNLLSNQNQTMTTEQRVYRMLFN